MDEDPGLFWNGLFARKEKPGRSEEGGVGRGDARLWESARSRGRRLEAGRKHTWDAERISTSSVSLYFLFFELVSGRRSAKGCEHEGSCQHVKAFNMADPQVVGESQFIRDIEKSAIDAFNEEHPYEQSFYNDVAGFVAAVNWEADGHWLAAFAAVHAVFFILIVFCRRVEIVQLATFVSICGVVMASEVVNAFLHEHWRDFATQDYFDEHGVFFSCLFSGPLLILGFLQVRYCVPCCPLSAQTVLLE